MSVFQPTVYSEVELHYQLKIQSHCSLAPPFFFTGNYTMGNNYLNGNLCNDYIFQKLITTYKTVFNLNFQVLIQNNFIVTI